MFWRFGRIGLEMLEVALALALSAWLRIVAQAGEVCTCDPEICRSECDLSRSCSECGNSGHDTVH